MADVIAIAGGHDFFGGSIAMQGDILAVGAKLHGSGSVYMLSHSSNRTWQEYASIWPYSTDEGSLYFGSSINIYGDNLIVGATHAGGGTGAAFK